ncbi:MAG: glycosyltransferase family 2 protein [Gemmataceae bacterium]|nr:glycosyltransferase family 2 protein [Gemmataceae bacterium]
MQDSPLISVIMSVHNHEAFVGQAVESVLAQTFPAWELILIDNGSTDRSPELIDALARRDPRIRPIHQDNIGLPAARNRGIGLARGAWIAYLDSDDLWFPIALETYARHVAAQPRTRFVFGFAHRLRGARITVLPGRHQDRPAGTRELFERMFLAPLTVCHQRDLWEQAGRFDGALRWCDDYDLFLRMSLRCRFEPLGHALGLRRRHGSNLSAPSGRSQQAEAEVLRRFAEGAGRTALDDELVGRRLGQVYARAARRYLGERDYGQALALAQEAQALAPTWRNRLLCRLCGWLAPRTPAPPPARVANARGSPAA